MKKLIGILFCFLIFFLSNCYADLAWYTVKSYDWIFQITNNWDLNVKEIIKLNFDLKRHWIYRNIPIKYRVDDYRSIETPIKNISVSWYKYSTEISDWLLNIKIGDPNVYLIWEKTFEIRYTVKWAVRSFSWFQSLYRNVSPTDFNADIPNFNFAVLLPHDVSDELLDYYWVFWKIWSNGGFEMIRSWNVLSNLDPLFIHGDEAVTIWVKLPDWYVKTNLYTDFNYTEYIIDKAEESPILFLITMKILLVLIVVLSFFIYKKIKRQFEIDKWLKIRNVIYYDPPKWYSPMDLAVINQWKANFTVFSVMLYKWMGEWKIDIVKEDSWSFFKKTKIYFKAKDYKKTLKSFPKNKNWTWIKASHLKGKRNYFTIIDPEKSFREFCFENGWVYYPDIPLKRSEINLLKKIADEFFYRVNSNFVTWIDDFYDNVRSTTSWRYFLHIGFNKWKISESILLLPFIFMFFMLILSKFLSWRIFLIIFVSSFVILVLSRILFYLYNKFKLIHSLKIERQRFTDKWKEVVEHLFGFKKYLMTVDDARLERMIKDDPSYFEKIFPYALALWVWDKWIKKCFPFIRINKDYHPYWIEDFDSWNTFSNSVSAASLTWTAAVASRSYSSSISDSSWWSDSWWSWWDSSSGWSSWSSWWWWGWWSFGSW